MAIRESDWDPIGEENVGDPVREQRRLRETCPVAYSEQFGGFWSVFKADDIKAVAHATDDFVSSPQFMVPKLDVGVPWVPLQADPPLHSIYRKIISPYFRGGRLEGFEPTIRQLTNQYIDRFIDKELVDVAQELSIAIPGSAICLLMGLPLRYHSDFSQWTIDMVQAGATGDMTALDRVYAEIFAFVDEWMERTREQPAEDLMSELINAQVDGRPITKEEIQGMFLLMATAGHETTANTLSSSIGYLAEHPEISQRLRDNPDLMPNAVSEFARYFAPVQGQARTAAHDLEIGGRAIKAGEPIVLMFSSGSRDSELFEDPDACTIDRRDSHKLQSFGTGIHRCVGEPLARMELRVVLTEFLSRIDTWEVVGSPIPAMWPAIGFHHLNIKFEPRAG